MRLLGLFIRQLIFSVSDIMVHIQSGTVGEGMPQGNSLAIGPLLFLGCINDFPSQVHDDKLLYIQYMLMTLP